MHDKSNTALDVGHLTQVQLTQIQETIQMFRGLSRKELAATLCETLQWSSSKKSNKILLCLDLLKDLEELGVVKFLKPIDVSS